MKTLTPCLPRIAYSAALPVSPEVAPRMLSVCAAARQFVLEQVAEQLHRHVLEGQRRAVGQGLAGTGRRSSGFSGVISRRAEDLRRCRSASTSALQVGGRDVVDVERQDLEGQLGIRQAAPARQRGARRPAGSASGRYRPPSGARPSSRMSEKPRGVCVAAGAEVLQLQFFLADAHDRRQHRRQRLHLRDAPCSSRLRRCRGSG